MGKQSRFCLPGGPFPHSWGDLPAPYLAGVVEAMAGAGHIVGLSTSQRSWRGWCGLNLPSNGGFGGWWEASVLSHTSWVCQLPAFLKACLLDIVSRYQWENEATAALLEGSTIPSHAPWVCQAAGFIAWFKNKKSLSIS